MKIKKTISFLLLFSAGIYFWKIADPLHLYKEALATIPDSGHSSSIEESSSQDIIAFKEQNSKTEQKEQRNIETQIIDFQKKRDIPALVNLYEKQPRKILENERASILLARALMHSDNSDSYDEVLYSWADRKNHTHSWFLLKADKLIYQGKSKQAIALLNSKTLKGKLDSGRLIRLAITNLNSFPKKSWGYLKRAVDLDPKNPDVRTFQAQILENAGKKELARKEYVAAYLANPKNPLLKDQLAEFYRRNGNINLALKTWTENISNETPDFIKLKAYFWGRVYKPQNINLSSLQVETSRYHQLLKFLNQLLPGEYWNEVEYKKVPEGRRFEFERQEVFWLQLLNEIKRGDEKKSLDLLERSPFKLGNSIQPELQAALHWILAYRNNKTIYVEDPSELKFFKPSRANHQFLNKIFRNTGRAYINPRHNSFKGLDKFLSSEEVFAGAFLAAGWIESAIQFSSVVSIPEEYPDWFAYGLTQAYRFNQGNKTALDFARMQVPSNAMNLLIGEMLLVEGQIKQARKILENLASLNTGEGFRSAWLLSQSYLSAHLFQKAKHVVFRQSSLADSVIGKELLANIYLSEGNIDKAEQVYSAIVKDSPQAKVYLARKSLQEGDYSNARRYTELLAFEFPGQLQFIENLRKITELEAENETI
jgi:thioredoxin-like negative regulator of GroEL